MCVRHDVEDAGLRFLRREEKPSLFGDHRLRATHSDIHPERLELDLEGPFSLTPGETLSGDRPSSCEDVSNK